MPACTCSSHWAQPSPCLVLHHLELNTSAHVGLKQGSASVHGPSSAHDVVHMRFQKVAGRQWHQRQACELDGHSRRDAHQCGLASRDQGCPPALSAVIQDSKQPGLRVAQEAPQGPRQRPVCDSVPISVPSRMPHAGASDRPLSGAGRTVHVPGDAGAHHHQLSRVAGRRH